MVFIKWEKTGGMGGIGGKNRVLGCLLMFCMYHYCVIPSSCVWLEATESIHA